MKYSIGFLFFSLAYLPFLSAQHFVEAQQEAGIDHIVSHASFMGGGAAFFDADNDGDDDLYITSGKEVDHFYVNNGDGTFTLSSEAAGFTNTSFYYTTGVVSGDVDNDGFKDLFVINWGSDTASLAPNFLYHNNGDGTFTETQPFPEDASFSIGATFLDYDLDGWLDLYVVNYVAEANFLYDGNVVVGFDHTCFSNQFYRNNGDGTFTEVSQEVNLADTGCALATTATDYDMDGDMDIYIANDFGEFIQPNKLYRNNITQGNFTEVGEATNAAVPMYGMGIAVGDIDQDLDFDYYITNFGRNAMIRNEGGSFTNITELCGAGNEWVVEDTSLTVGWGTAFIDIDNDSDLDLYVANGYVPSPGFLPSTLFMNDKLYLNNAGELPFSDVGESYGITNKHATRGMSYSDFDNDGDIDILAVVLNVPINLPVGSDQYATLLYRNEAGNLNNWFQVTLEGVEANRDAYGSKVIVYADGKALLQEMSGGASHASHYSSRLHFGLADASTVDSVSVIWTGGRRTQTSYDFSANQVVHIVEDTTIANVAVGINELFANDNQFKLYPNPTSQSVTLSWKTSQPINVQQLQLFTATGQLVKQQKTAISASQADLPLDVSSLPSGVYYLLVRTDQGVLSKKLVVGN
jgi:hypothetical protein